MGETVNRSKPFQPKALSEIHPRELAVGHGRYLTELVHSGPAYLKRHYRDGWETFIGNAGCIQTFANNDQTTLEYLSKRLGGCEVMQLTRNTSSSTAISSNHPGANHQMQSLMAGRGEAGVLTSPLSLLIDPESSGHGTTTTESANAQMVRTPLLLADEIASLFARETSAQIVLINGQPPMCLRRMKQTSG